MAKMVTPQKVGNGKWQANMNKLINGPIRPINKEANMATSKNTVTVKGKIIDTNKLGNRILHASSFGHNITRMSGQIDEMVLAGYTDKQIVEALTKQFGVDAAHAAKKLHSHVRTLRTVCGIDVSKENDRYTVSLH